MTTAPRSRPAVVAAPEPIDTDPAVVAQLIDRNRASVAEELRAFLFDPQGHRALMAGFEAT